MTIPTKMNENVIPEKETQDDVSCELSDCNINSENSAMKASLENQSKEALLENQSKEASLENQSKEASLENQSEEEWMDILGSGQLKKKVLKKGSESIQPHRGDICTIKLFGILDDGTPVEDHDALKIQIGDMEVIQGLDLTIVLMELGEMAEIVVEPRFAYGVHGGIKIPPNATITYTVTLMNIEDEPEIETLSIIQRRKIGNKKRERGNWWFIRKEFSYAIQCYRRALQYLNVSNSKRNENEETETVTDADLQALLNDSIKVYNNLAAALIETESYNTALENVELVLKYQPNNTKALFRKGKILKIKGEYGKAYMTFLEAQKLEPEMKSVQVELMSLKDKISKQSMKEKNLYAKMLGINKDFDKPPKNVKIENKSKIAKRILWTVLGASAAIVGILVHKFVS